MLMNIDQVKEFLPHRDPFLFIDCIEKIDFPQREDDSQLITLRQLTGTIVKAHFSVKEDMGVLRGHFPGNPIVPGVCQVEMMAQAACFAITGCIEDISKVTLEVALLGAESCKFRKPVKPGMNLVINAECIKSRPPFSHYECNIECDGEVVSQAKIFASCRF